MLEKWNLQKMKQFPLETWFIPEYYENSIGLTIKITISTWFQVKKEFEL